ncbi:Uncharacterized protein FWK35_00006517 [Aphis craccivora]|uniref:Uncharacterized protein n=1 Tax=Aphis craccivora TaxID=307492 RepID=A0A6G0YWF6_APHCR|nr:Uncharacterized protein FWK35_00006517 [Aphis craccivora]
MRRLIFWFTIERRLPPAYSPARRFKIQINKSSLSYNNKSRLSKLLSLPNRCFVVGGFWNGDRLIRLAFLATASGDKRSCCASVPRQKRNGAVFVWRRVKFFNTENTHRHRSVLAVSDGNRTACAFPILVQLPGRSPHLRHFKCGKELATHAVTVKNRFNSVSRRGREDATYLTRRALHTVPRVFERKSHGGRSQGNICFRRNVPNTTRRLTSAIPPSPVTGDRWVVVCHSNVLRDSCGPVTSDAAAVFTHHAGHSNRRLDT